MFFRDKVNEVFSIPYRFLCFFASGPVYIPFGIKMIAINSRTQKELYGCCCIFKRLAATDNKNPQLQLRVFVIC